MLAFMSTSKMLGGIYEMAVTATIMMNMQERDLILTGIAEWKIILEYELNRCKIMYRKFRGDAGTIYI